MIRWAEDLGAPALVTGADMLVDRVKPSMKDAVGIGLAAAGYIGAYTGYGGLMLKNVGIAAAPWAFKAIVAKVSGAGITRGLSVRSRVSRWPAPAYLNQFDGTKLD